MDSYRERLDTPIANGRHGAIVWRTTIAGGLSMGVEAVSTEEGAGSLDSGRCPEPAKTSGLRLCGLAEIELKKDLDLVAIDPRHDVLLLEK